MKRWGIFSGQDSQELAAPCSLLFSLKAKHPLPKCCIWKTEIWVGSYCPWILKCSEVFDTPDEKSQNKMTLFFPVGNLTESLRVKLIYQWAKWLSDQKKRVLSLICKIYSWFKVKILVQLWMSQIKFDYDPGNSVSHQLISKKFLFPMLFCLSVSRTLI